MTDTQAVNLATLHRPAAIRQANEQHRPVFVVSDGGGVRVVRADTWRPRFIDGTRPVEALIHVVWPKGWQYRPKGV